MPSFTQQDIDDLRDLLGDSSKRSQGGVDRGGFYLAYYDLINSIDPDAAKEVLLAAQQA